MRRLLCLLALACSVTLLTAAPASASNVFISGGEMEYQAAAGETNDLSISEGGGVFTVSDPGATITPIAPCASVNAHTATCPQSMVFGFSADLADLNDQGRIADSVVLFIFFPSSLAGGPGQDNLTAGKNTFSVLLGGDDADVLNGNGFSDGLDGGGGNDVLNGGPGSDQLEGDDGDDVMNGNAGSDSISTDGPLQGADTMNGGPGIDDLGYSRTNPVNISLDGAPNDGEGCPGPACENDNVGGDIEDVSGGDGNDVLTGNAADNELSGERGNDTIDGGGGDDSLFGNDGADSLGGGAGADFTSGGDATDTMSGGKGDDTLADNEEDEAPDVFAGGAGSDTADYGGTDFKLKITLDGKPNDGIVNPAFLPPTDNVKADVENIFGGLGADILVGSKRANQLEGGDGNDQLLGGAGADGLLGENGDDSLIGGKGRDLLDGAAGKDRIASRDHKPDEVECGSSLDRVKADRVDRTSPDCEKVRRS